jgi:hypothetical protein
MSKALSIDLRTRVLAAVAAGGRWTRRSGSSPVTGSRARKHRARQRTGSSRRPEAARGLVRGPAGPRPGAARLHRRDLSQDQHGTNPRPSPARPAPAGRRAARPLEDHHRRRRSHPARHDRSLRALRAHQPRGLRGLPRAGPRARAQARRCRRHGQPLQPQGAQGPRADRGRRRPASLPPALQPGLQPDRKCLARLKALLARPPNPPSPACGARSDASSTSSTRPNAPTISPAAGYDAD